MEPLPDAWSLRFLVSGIVLNVTGIGMGTAAVLRAHHAYGDGQRLLPWLWDGLRRRSEFVKKLNPWADKEATSLQVDAVEHVHVTDSVALRQHVAFRDDMDLDEKLLQLAKSVDGVYADIAQYKELHENQHCEIRADVAQVQQHAEADRRQLQALVRRVVSSDVRLQVAGLGAIAFGTLLVSVPPVWDVLASVW